MSKGHRSKYKRLRNVAREVRPFAILRNVKLSDTKARVVLNKIKGMGTVLALAKLSFSPRYSAQIIAKLLKSAMSNAENNLGLSPDKLYIEVAVAGRAGIGKRIRARAKGRAYRIQKKFCNIKLILNESFN